MFPSRKRPEEVVTCPANASMAIRPCLISTKRRRSKRSWSALSRSPRGSQNPRGSWTPSSELNALRVVEVSATLEGANAAADAARVVRIASFILILLRLFI